MNTRSLPFELEQTARGTFLLQALAGGMLVGFLFMEFMVLRSSPGPYFFLLIPYLAIVIAASGVLGVLVGIPLWAMYRLTKIRMTAPVRIAITSISLTLLVSLLQYLFTPTYLLSVVVIPICLLISLPVALLVGSRVQPGLFFTFWSIELHQNGLRRRSRLTDIGLITGVLPLRLLSAIGLICSLFAAAAVLPVLPRMDQSVADEVLFGPGALVYFVLTIYLTFRSPGESVLLAIGLLINVPVVLLILRYFTGYSGTSVVGDPLGVIVCMFLLALWAIFIVTRFVVEPDDFLPQNAVNAGE